MYNVFDVLSYKQFLNIGGLRWRGARPRAMPAPARLRTISRLSPTHNTCRISVRKAAVATLVLPNSLLSQHIVIILCYMYIIISTHIICIYICICICIHTCVYLSLSIYIYIYIHICIYVYMYNCISVYLYICISVYLYVYIYKYMMCMYIYIYVYT